MKRFLIIKKGVAACAVKFVDARREPNTDGQSFFSSGDDTQIAHYEWHYQGDGTFDFLSISASSGTGTVSKLPLRGLGRLAFQFGNPVIGCGPLSVDWMFPTRASFGEEDGQQDHPRVFVAPTGWATINKVNLHDTRLKWYKSGDVEKILFVPLIELPGAE